MVNRLAYGVLIWLLSMGLSWATVESRIDHSEVALGDAVELVISATDLASSVDLSPLEADFDIASRRQESQFNYTNGQGSQRTRWILTLYPKRVGVLQVPALSIGSESTNPLSLTVKDAPTTPPATSGAKAASNHEVIIEFDSEPQQPLVQQQVILTQRLLTNFSLDAAQASLTLPQIESGKALLRQLGNPTSRRLERNGKSYEVVERRFALIPQQSGTVTLGRTVFDGVVPDENATSHANDPLGRYFAFGEGLRSVRRFSKPFEISVAPQDPSFTGTYWLPATSVTLNASWDKPLDQLKAGEPVTLTAAIIAEGLTAEQLPALTVPAPVGIKAYTDQPTLKDQVQESGVIGVRQEKWVFIASGGGDFTIPEITLDWWNIKTGQQETARLDATQFKVGGEPLAVTPPKPAQPAKDIPVKDQATVQPKQSTEPESGISIGLWVLILGFVAAVLGIIAYRHGRRQPNQTTSKGTLPLNSLTKGSLNHLLQACDRNDKHAAYQGLIAWARDVIGVPTPYWANLYQRATPELQVAMDSLERSLYGQSQQASLWRGNTLAQAVRAIPKSAMPAATTPRLVSLHPSP